MSRVLLRLPCQVALSLGLGAVLLLAGCPPPPRVEAPPPPAGAVDFRIESEPSGADVQVDGHARGVTPVTVPLAPGRHTLRLAKSGYFALDTGVDVGPTGGAFKGTLVSSH
ncbi:MAG: PEGA domain-containing protein [Myxococcota bacterium]